MGELKKLSFRRIKKDNKGSAIVMVVIALAFIAILGVTIMWMSLSNFRMKATDQKNKQGFYTAETVFEQIKTGLQGDASQAANLAYSFVMQNYSNFSTELQREVEFKKEFKRCLIKLVSEDPSGMSTTYKVSHLSRYVDENLNISIDKNAKGDPIRFLGASRKDPFSGIVSVNSIGDIEGPNPAPGGEETDYIVLRGVVLEYTDNDGFYSEINTDIMISAPSTSFVDSSSLPPVFDYAMIADEGIDINETSSLTVDGGIYAGSDGINIRSNPGLSVRNFDKTISKGPITLAKVGSKLTTTRSVSNDSIVYASDLDINQSMLEMDADTRVKDDLAIKGDGSGKVVRLSGRYCGFSNDRFENDSSSAIVINGLNTHVDMSGLDKLVLAGRSFVATRSARTQSNGVDPGEPHDLSGNSVPVYANNYNVKMGESIAVKGNQLAYLVPSECIAAGSKVVKGKNPMTWAELDTFTREQMGDPGLKIVDYATTRVSWLDNNTLDYFMPGSSDNYIQKVFAPSNGEVLCYFYVVLDDAKQITITTGTTDIPAGTYDAASLYSQMYYSAHKDKMNRYMGAYAPDISLPSLANTFSAAALISSSSSPAPNGTQGHTLSKALTGTEIDECKKYRDEYDGLCWDLSGKTVSGNELLKLSANNLVFENTLQVSSNAIVNPDETNIASFLQDPQVGLNGGGSGNVSEFIVPSGSHAGLKALLVDTTNDTVDVSYTDEDGHVHGETNKDVYVFDDSTNKTRIIISNVDIYLKTSFNGIIITNKKIYTAPGYTPTVTGMGKNLSMKEEIMAVLGSKYKNDEAWDKTKPISWRPIDFFKNGSDFMGTSDSESGTGRVDIDSCVNFMNWIKN